MPSGEKFLGRIILKKYLKTTVLNRSPDVWILETTLKKIIFCTNMKIPNGIRDANNKIRSLRLLSLNSFSLNEKKNKK